MINHRPRHAGSTYRNVQEQINWVVSRIATGTPQARFFPGGRLAPPITVGKREFQYTAYGTEHLARYDTERALGAPRSHSNWTTSIVTGKLRSFGHEVMKDIRELANANPNLMQRSRSAQLAFRIVRNDTERVIRDTIFDNTAYPAANSVDLTGAEWGTGSGDVKAAVIALADIIIAGTPLQREDLQMFLPRLVKDAALEDPTFLAARTRTNPDQPVLADLRSYLGIGEIWTANPIEDVDGTVTSIYPDTALLYYPGEGADYDAEYGDLDFAHTFRLDQGRAPNAYYDEHTTTWYFPFDDDMNCYITNSSMGGLLENAV